jgi:L-aspartate oxidase
MTTDFLVIGGGIAGLSFALQAAAHSKVLILTKNAAGESNTRYAQGGIACVMRPDDDFNLHIEDTLKAGDGLCNREAVEIMVREAPASIERLLEWGVNFNQKGNVPDTALEGGHSRKRILHKNDSTGNEIEQALVKAVMAYPNIEWLSFHTCIDLIIDGQESDEPQCLGAWVLDANKGRIFPVISKYTLLCTGGAGQVYSHTTNPEIATGDGLAIAYRAGALLQDLEFVQFHPTMLYSPGRPSFLISEALRGAGAELVDAEGKSFMLNYHPMGSLAPRDTVSRAIFTEMQRLHQPYVYLDARAVPFAKLRSHFNQIYSVCFEQGINISEDLIPVSPAAHYLCGGVKTDFNGLTSLRNLYAIGEVACTGVHGANRLASNSLLEALVFSDRALKHILTLQDIQNDLDYILPDYPNFASPKADIAEILEVKEKIQSIMWEYCGILRSTEELNYGATLLNLIEPIVDRIFINSRISQRTLELRNLFQTAWLIITAAGRRKGSHGAHYLTDGTNMEDSEPVVISLSEELLGKEII